VPEFQPLIIRLDSTPSTNDYLLQLAKSNPVEPFTVVSAIHQTQGKGQRGRTWESSAGDHVTLSMFLQPSHTSLDHGFGLSMLSALAVYDVLQEIGIDEVHIKWPNDIYIGHRKCAGILIERIWTGQRLQFAVVGVGINVRNRPRQLAQAIALDEVANVSITPAEIETRLIHHLYQRISNWHLQPITAIRNEYHLHLYGRFEERRFETVQQSFSGTIQEVDEIGRLVIRTDSGEIQKFQPTDITFLT
jgi:BirA family transcriptional regulator, biotin operon repressor / biotin---[acetyl-CoA-carboxylase] ligase